MPKAGPARPVVGRDFPGGTDQVRLARHWIEDLLPPCDPLADIALVASELCTNAIVHTRSGSMAGGSPSMSSGRRRPPGW